MPRNYSAVAGQGVFVGYSAWWEVWSVGFGWFVALRFLLDTLIFISYC